MAKDKKKKEPLKLTLTTEQTNFLHEEGYLIQDNTYLFLLDPEDEEGESIIVAKLVKGPKKLYLNCDTQCVNID